MKKIHIILAMAVLLGILASCSTDVELYADYKDIPVVYGLIDASQDTNFVRINRAFSSSNDHPINAHEVALIADSCNYPGKLDARIVEYKAVYANYYEPTGRVLQLDTMTLHNKEQGTFYAPHQKVYYTTKPFNVNTAAARYKYKLFINKGNDTITSETGLVGGEGFRIVTSQTYFTPEPNDKSGKINFKTADNAVFYDVKMVFNYIESHNGSAPVAKQVKWNFGAHRTDELGYDEQQHTYYVSYGENTLFSMLESAIGADTINVTRYFSAQPIEISITAGGDELYNYIQVNTQGGGFSQTVPDYTNVTGGYGVFSSRIKITKKCGLQTFTQASLIGKSWGFKQEQP